MKTRELNLERISSEAGRALLRVGGVRGTDAELEAASRAFGNHALAVHLLARFLVEIPGHPISVAMAIPDLEIPDDAGRHPRRVMAAFEQRFGDGVELELLGILGLFNRPAAEGALAAVRAEPPIAGLCAQLLELSEVGWLKLVEKLRGTGLIAPESLHRPGELDAHPLVREHFGTRLAELWPEAWREGHRRLYRHFRDTAKKLPDTLREMTPLYLAVAHGCEAGLQPEVLREVFWPRISRDMAFFSTEKLGAYGSELAALRGFFVSCWDETVGNLDAEAEAAVLNSAGYCLQALGELRQALTPMEAALEKYSGLRQWYFSSEIANNIAEIYLVLGELPKALAMAEESTRLARCCGSRQPIIGWATCAEVQHRLGELQKAERLLSEAGQRLQQNDPEALMLHGVPAFRLCELLLDQGKLEQAAQVARKALEWAMGERRPLERGLAHLSLGRQGLEAAQRAGRRASSTSVDHFAQAVEEVRAAGQVRYLPEVLLGQAGLYLAQGRLQRARADLDAALACAAASRMRLHEAECHLGSARSYLAGRQLDRARTALQRADLMVREMGYARRQPELLLLQARLAQAHGKPADARRLLSEARDLIDRRGQHGLDWQYQEAAAAVEKL